MWQFRAWCHVGHWCDPLGRVCHQLLGALQLCRRSGRKHVQDCKTNNHSSSFAGDILNTKPSFAGRFEEENVWKNRHCQKPSSVWSADLTASIHFASLLD